jgi:hypothetical protein
MHTVHNARITLLATALNNLALAVSSPGSWRPPPAGKAWRLAGRDDARLDRLRNRLTCQRATRAREAAVMTWDQAWVWLIWPAILTAIICAGGICASRRIP